MEPQVRAIRDEYVNAVKRLFAEIKSWLKESPLIVREEETEINEERVGTYKVEMLSIQDQKNREIAKMRPIGAWIIAAKGRIDIEGPIDSEVLIYLENGAPVMRTTINSDGTILETTSRSLFRGVEKPGWYWVEDKIRGRASLLDKNLLLELLSEVSDHEL